jgi:uncharacterized membrane protein YphA (DoxX/SURF4 family)
VQRLFSMFPTGAAGWALFVLRISVVVSSVAEGTKHWALVTSWWSFLLFLLPAMMIALGFLTPYACVFEVLLLSGVAMHFGGEDRFHLLAAMVNTGVLALLGPGAYSVDAQIFGRRLLIIQPRR